MRTKKLLAMLPAWLLVATILVIGSGSGGHGHHGHGHGYHGWGGWGGYGGCGCNDPPSIDINQENYGGGNNRLNLANATIDYNGGYGGYYYGGYGYPGGSIDINQENYGWGNNRDNVAFASWSW